jgi:hypothetical protein
MLHQQVQLHVDGGWGTVRLHQPPQLLLLLPLLGGGCCVRLHPHLVHLLHERLQLPLLLSLQQHA